MGSRYWPQVRPAILPPLTPSEQCRIGREDGMNNLRLLLTLFSLVASATAQSNGAPAKIDASAIWQMSSQFLATARAACNPSDSKNIDCPTGQMAKAGASPHAVSFTRELYEQSHGDFGVMTGFQDLGAIAFAAVTYPLRANTNNGLLVLNGQPWIVDLEDLKLLDTKAMEQSAQFKDVKGQYPSVNLWPGDRDGTTWPTPEAGAKGGSRFLLSYPLRNGCHACASAGSAIFGWNFDSRGKLTGTTFEGLIAPPL